MARPVDTIHYYPQHIRNIEEFQRIAAAYDKELRLIWTALGAQQENQYFDTMDEDTCARWESLIGIKLVGDETLVERRIAIKGRWTSSLPYTEPKFHEVLKAMVGDYYTLNISVQQKVLKAGIFLAQMLKVDSVYDIMRAMAPADMNVIVKIIYNRWGRFYGMTWGDLWNQGQDTWNDVKANEKWQEE